MKKDLDIQPAEIKNKIERWIEPEEEKDKQKQQKTSSHYQKYNKNYNKLHKKLNITNPLYEQLKNIVAQQYKMTMHEAGNLLVLFFLKQHDPVGKLDHIRQTYQNELKKNELTSN